MPQEAITYTAEDRRQRFRTFARRFNPTAPAKEIIDQGLVCSEAGRSILRKLIRGFDLPGGQQLVVGGIGSGKTTELLLAERELISTPEMLPLYVDVPADTDLSAVTSGSLLASLGLRMWKEIAPKADSSRTLAGAFEVIKKAAEGYETRVLVPPPFRGFAELTRTEAQYETVRVPGKLKPPSAPLAPDVKQLADAVYKVLSTLTTQGNEVLVIFDGLDRLIKPDQFWLVCEHDLHALKGMDVSIAIAGPLSVLYGAGRQVTDFFDQVHHIPPAIADPKASPFLLEILEKRGVQDFIHDKAQRSRICLTSGGVLRDLISLTRSAGQNAYLDDCDWVEPRHVNRAVVQLGNAYLLGLGTEQKRIIDEILRGKPFSPSNPECMELLVTRRILERDGSLYEVHPALAEVLRTQAEP